jgi:hypothetical protein
MEWLSLTDLTAIGVATAGSVAQATATNHGFGFSIQGIPPAGAILGPGLWASNITFQTGGTYTISAQVAPTGSPVWNIQTLISGVYTTIGTITWTAGSTSAVLAWLSSPVLIPAAQPLQIALAAMADATLANVTGLIDGVFS